MEGGGGVEGVDGDAGRRSVTTFWRKKVVTCSCINGINSKQTRRATSRAAARAHPSTNSRAAPHGVYVPIRGPRPLAGAHGRR